MSTTNREPEPPREAVEPKHWLVRAWRWYAAKFAYHVSIGPARPESFFFVLGSIIAGIAGFIFIVLPPLIFALSPLLVMVGVWNKMWYHLASVVSNF